VVLVQVDHVDLEALERRLDRLADVGLRSARARLGTVGALHVHPELGGDDDLVATALQDLTEVRLALAALGSVDVGGVEEVDPGVDCGVDDRARAVEVDAAAEVVAAESNLG
jgi:hypothetical protein